MFKLSGLGDPSGRGEGFSFLPRKQREASGRAWKEVFPTLDQALQDIIADTPPFKFGVALMNQILNYIWSVPALRRTAQHRLSMAGYETELPSLMRLVRQPKKIRVEVILDIDDSNTAASRTGAGVQEYYKTCNRIWNKQVNALSDPAVQFGDEDALLDDLLDLEEGAGAQALSLIHI